MGENKCFSTKYVSGQLISLVNVSIIKKLIKKHDAERYIIYFKCKNHLFSMISCFLDKSNSLREVTGGIPG